MKLTFKQKRLAVIVMAGFVLLLVGRLWSNHTANSLYGPSALSVWTAADGTEQVWVFAGQYFYRLSAQGAVLDRLPASDFSLASGTHEIQAVSGNQLLLSDPATRTILNCQIKPPLCRPLWQQRESAEAGPISFHLDSQRNILFIADNAAHRLFMQTANSRQSRPLTSIEELRYPNDIWMDEQQTLWVADTNNHRIVGLRPNGKAAKGQFILKSNLDTGTASHTWPIALTRDHRKQFWGLFANPFLRHAELIRFDANRKPDLRVGFPGQADVVAIASMGENLLAADMENHVIYQVNTRNGETRAFGQPEFTALLNNRKARQQRYHWIARGCLLAMLLLLIPAFWLARQVSRDETAARQAYLARHKVRVN